ncbi:Uncharacterised protein [uncultured archaeon]|nr:Uncharacterised protein [uncultured archaeon]
MKSMLDESRNPFDERIVMYAHIIGEMQKFPTFSEEDRMYLKDIFYKANKIMYHQLSNQEMRKLRAKILHYSGIKSWTISENKGAVI